MSGAVFVSTGRETWRFRGSFIEWLKTPWDWLRTLVGQASRRSFQGRLLVSGATTSLDETEGMGMTRLVVTHWTQGGLSWVTGCIQVRRPEGTIETTLSQSRENIQPSRWDLTPWPT